MRTDSKKRKKGFFPTFSGYFSFSTPSAHPHSLSLIFTTLNHFEVLLLFFFPFLEGEGGSFLLV